MAEEAFDEIVPQALDGQRIDRVIALIADVSRRLASDMVTDGTVLVDGETAAKPSQRLAAGQNVVFRLNRPSSRPQPDPSVPVDVVHADEQLLIVDKQPGVVVHPGSGVHDSTLVNGLLARFPEIADVGDRTRPGIVHRLDRGTSGLMVVARTALAYGDLVEQLKKRTVERRYRSLVVGHLVAERGLIDAPLGRAPRRATRRAVVADGLDARTHYHVLRRFAVAPDPLEGSPSELRLTLIECWLETGRTHQIRAHFAAIGHPVAGDSDYGASVAATASLGLGRPFLHAERLELDHPTSGERLAFLSPLPDDLEAVLVQLGGAT